MADERGKAIEMALHRLRNSSARARSCGGVERGNRPYRSDSDWMISFDAALGVGGFREAA